MATDHSTTSDTDNSTDNSLGLDQLSAVSNTALLTLWARALEAASPDPVLVDPQAIKVVETLRPYLATSANPMHQQLVADQLPKLLVLTTALRAAHFDTLARNFLNRFPRGVVVNLGAGLDTRFARLNATPEGRHARVVEIDLPPMIALKRALQPPHTRHEMIAASVLDLAWLDALDRYENRRFIFLAEGLFMYFPPAEVKRLVVALATRFPGSELVADLFHGFLLREPWRSWTARKMQRQLHFAPDAAFHFGVDSPREIATWHPQIQFLDEWSFLDAPTRRLGAWRWLRHITWLRRIQFVARYQLG